MSCSRSAPTRWTSVWLHASTARILSKCAQNVGRSTTHVQTSICIPPLVWSGRLRVNVRAISDNLPLGTSKIDHQTWPWQQRLAPLSAFAFFINKIGVCPLYSQSNNQASLRLNMIKSGKTIVLGKFIVPLFDHHLFCFQIWCTFL